MARSSAESDGTEPGLGVGIIAWWAVILLSFQARERKDGSAS